MTFEYIFNSDILQYLFAYLTFLKVSTVFLVSSVICTAQVRIE